MLFVRCAATLVFGFLVCLTAAHLTDGMDANEGSSWVMCLVFGGLAGLGAGHVAARNRRIELFEHVCLCVGAAAAAGVATGQLQPPVFVVLLCVVMSRAGYLHVRARPDGEEE